MGVPADLEFEDAIQQRIYHHVETSGSATVEEVRDEVRIDSPSGSKPARSGTAEPQVRVPAEEFHNSIAALVESGLLVLSDGELHLAMDDDVEDYDEDDLSYRIRQGHQSDWRGIETAIREVADEGASISAERVADDIGDEGALLRRNDRRSRMFYVATVDSGENEGEVAGWVHLDAPKLDQLRHTAELTVGVRGPYREHGIGGQLLERAMNWARDTGYTKVYQSLPATNETAIELLKDYGWETEAVRADHYIIDDEFVDEVMMARKL